MQKPGSGFTLVEVLFVIVIAMILAAIGVPSFNNVLRSNRIAASVNDVISSIQLARSEASKRGLSVSLCPTDEINVANPTCSAGADWHEGYIGFIDVNADGARDGGDELVLAHGPFPKDVFILASAQIADGLTYGGDGFPIALPDAVATLVFCDNPTDVSRARLLTVSSTGRPMVVRTEALLAGLQCSS